MWLGSMNDLRQQTAGSEEMMRRGGKFLVQLRMHGMAYNGLDVAALT